jgi:hypothetical protein
MCLLSNFYGKYLLVEESIDFFLNGEESIDASVNSKMVESPGAVDVNVCKTATGHHDDSAANACGAKRISHWLVFSSGCCFPLR